MAAAMIETRVEFKGLDQIDEALKLLPMQVQRQVLRRGLVLAARVLQDGMMRRAPQAAEHRIIRRGKHYPRKLAHAIGYRIRFRKDGDPTAEVGPLTSAYWGMFVELGTRHQAARPFIRPTLDQDGQIAVAAFVAGAREALDAVVRRMRRIARRG
jgi:HK97 gp10 family phage protein